MIELGAVMLKSDGSMDETFYANFRPVSEKFIPEALAVSGYSHEQTKDFDLPQISIKNFRNWVNEVNGRGKPKFVSDNAGFDWQFVNYYMWRYLGENPFGFSSLSLTSLYKGFDKSLFSSFKHLRETKHDHNPVNDAKGNAEAFLKIKEMGLKAKL